MSDIKNIALTAEIIASFVSNNSVSIDELAALIRDTHGALAGVGQTDLVGEEATIETVKVSAAKIRKSITPDALISFVDGKPYKTLKRHLARNGLTVDQYKAKYGLPHDYPTTAPSYSAARSVMAKELGLGQGGRRGRKNAGAPGGSKAQKRN